MNKLIITWKKTPELESKRVKYKQYVPERLERWVKSISKNNPGDMDYVLPYKEAHYLTHDYNQPKFVDSFNTPAVESARKILSKRRIDNMMSAVFMGVNILK